MSYAPRRDFPRIVLALHVVFIFGFVGFANSQGLQTSPYSVPSMLRGPAGGGADGPGTLPITSGMLRDILPLIPNLQFGYFYNFGSNIRSDRATIDYIRPFRLSACSVIFGEAHAEFSDFWKTVQGSPNNRVDMSFGGGYRRMLGNATLVGINSFYDTARLSGAWYSSGSLGLEMAAELPGNDAIDLNFNWYGNLFQGSIIRNAFRQGPTNWDFQVGYSHELWNGGPDLRLSGTGYRFDTGRGIYGLNGAAELKSRDGVFVLRYAAGNDQINQTYHTVGATVNVGFEPERLLVGEMPFTMPEPIFKSPRNLFAWLSRSLSTVRNFSQPASVLIAQQSRTTGGSVTPSLTATATFGTPLSAGAGGFANLSPNVNFSDLGEYGTVTITFTPAPPNATGASNIRLASDTGALTVAPPSISQGQTTLILTRAGHSDWFGGVFSGSRFTRFGVRNGTGAPSATWQPTVTVTWTP